MRDPRMCDQCGEWMEWVEWKIGVGQVNGWHCEVCKMLVFPNKETAS